MIIIFIATVETVNVAHGIAAFLGRIFFSIGSQFSIWSLLAAMLIAAVWLTYKRPRRRNLTYLKRTLFPSRYLSGPSARVDWGMMFAAYFIFPIIFGAGTLALPLISNQFSSLLFNLSGKQSILAMEAGYSRALTTAIMFLAFELAYFVDHWTSHKLPIFWEFHKVHHSAETLSPITVFRVHPVESLKFGNIIVIITGAASGLSLWLFGSDARPLAIDGLNILLCIFVLLVLHLQHSQIWIPFHGWVGNLFLSPAHHQLHHSKDPAHFNSNYGNCLAIWDKLATTLRAPSSKSPQLCFGVEGLSYDPQSATGTLVRPFFDAFLSVLPPRFISQPAPSPVDANLETKVLGQPAQ